MDRKFKHVVFILLFFFLLLCSEAGADSSASHNFIYDPKPSILEKMEVTLLPMHVVMQICGLLNGTFTSKFQGNTYFLNDFYFGVVFWFCFGFFGVWGFFDSTNRTAAACPAH